MATKPTPSTNEVFCHWINQDTGEINTIPVSTPIEKVPLGFYVPHYSGSFKAMEKRKKKIIQSRMQ